jgi:hypothetical protein
VHCDGQHFTLLRQPVENSGALRSLDDILAAAQAADLVVQINPTTAARRFSLFGILAEK